ncbi:hypothetical protein C0992_002978 [Termitomyces sp. T32_za158]|nr:hypothetical protein C0992_002978 [Termitomyces sp. T32_za158]
MEYDPSRTEPSSVAIFWDEMRVVRRSAMPILGSLLLEYSFHLIQIAFAGHVSTLALAAVSLGSMTANVTGISILRGLASALDTMLPSAHTSARPEFVALWSQRMALLLFIAMIVSTREDNPTAALLTSPHVKPILAVWLHMETILSYLKQDPEIARLAGLYLRWLALGLPGAGLREISRRYFQCQGYFSVQTHIMLVVAPFNVLLNYLLVLGPAPFNLGFIGAPISVAISYTLVPLISIVYCVLFLPNAAKYPLSSEIFTDLGELTRLGVCGIGQIASEWWAWEILALLAAFLGPVAIASQSILLTLGSTTYQVGFAVACAAGVRVGHHLGAADHLRARGAAHASLVLGLMISLSLGAMYMLFRQTWAGMLSNDPSESALPHVGLTLTIDAPPDVVANVASIIPIIALFQIVEGNSCVTAGLLRATSRQVRHQRAAEYQRILSHRNPIRIVPGIRARLAAPWAVDRIHAGAGVLRGARDWAVSTDGLGRGGRKGAGAVRWAVQKSIVW